MGDLKSRGMEKLEKKMQSIDADSMRYRILESAKMFKSSWIDLGQALYSAWKDKLYKNWGYQQFETYSVKELGIRKQTALKLLRSYFFLEKEEPAFLKREALESLEPSHVPNYESVDMLRSAKSRKILDEQDYSELKKDILEKGKDYRDVKKGLTELIRQRNELEPDEARQQKRQASLKRLLGLLRSVKKEAEVSKFLPEPVLKDAESLIKKIESLLE
ncbi:MAG: hypothetical protein C4533_01485 [Candidatus Omnitrophota bacterium]|jgi:hypothetical protein|nr:MAG: hypothetical protein C4533_01485 [Candidatus Omnitrophota bacterium]